MVDGTEIEGTAMTVTLEGTQPPRIALELLAHQVALDFPEAIVTVNPTAMTVDEILAAVRDDNLGGTARDLLEAMAAAGLVTVRRA